MARHYSTREFFRQMPNALLDRYFQARGLFGDLDFSAIKENHPHELFAAWLSLPNGQRNEMDAEFREIFELSNISRRQAKPRGDGLMKPITAIYLVMLVAAPALVFAQDMPYPDFGSIAKQLPPSKEAPPATQPPIARPPASQAPGSQATTTLARETWHRSMARTPFPKAGCYTSSYPSTQWQEVPCSTAKARPHVLPATGLTPHNVGGALGIGDYSAHVSGSLYGVTGSFDSVTGATGESDSLAGNDNFSLQLNTNPFSTSLCDNPTCYGIQQYIYDSPGPVYIQYWLINHGSTCPSQTVANSGWDYYGGSAGAHGCYINGHQAPVVPNHPITELAGLSLIANYLPSEYPMGAQTVQLENSAGLAGDTIVGAQNDGDFLGIGDQWNTAEFNVFGYGSGSIAVLTPNPGTTIVVRTSVGDSTRSCSLQGFTVEQNSLDMVKVRPCCPGNDEILVTESNTAGATSMCACPAGFTWDPRAEACACVPKTAAEACGASVCANYAPDGCGGRIACPDNCPSGEICRTSYDFGASPCCHPPVPGQIVPNQCPLPPPVYWPCPQCPKGYRCMAVLGWPSYCVVNQRCPAGTHYCPGEPSCLPDAPDVSCPKHPPCTPKTTAEACGASRCAGGDMPDGCGGTITCPANCPRGEVCNHISATCCTPPIPGKTLPNQCPSPAPPLDCGSCNPLQGAECCNCNGGLWKYDQCFIPCSPKWPCNKGP